MIIGTAAVKNPGFPARRLHRLWGHIIVGLDARDGKVATDGWSKLTGHEGRRPGEEVQDYGVEGVIYTDIGTRRHAFGHQRRGDGQSSPRRSPSRSSRRAGCRAWPTSSGCAPSSTRASRGVICGRSIYSGELDFTAAQARADEAGGLTATDPTPARHPARPRRPHPCLPNASSCLDVTGGRVVKGVNFVELRDAGDPVEIAARYNEQGADELTFLDITATSDDRDLILHIVEAVAAEVFIPLTVGGGVRTVGTCGACSTPAPTR